MIRTHAKFVFWLISICALSACVPKVYVVDRQTVLEQEAAGHWPEMERELLKKAKAQGPTPFAKLPAPGASSSGETDSETKKRARLYNVLNGSLEWSDEK